MLNVVSVKRSDGFFTVRDVGALLAIIAIFSLVEFDARQMHAPIDLLLKQPLLLDWHSLPEYALRTTLRMLIAIVASLIFTIIYATIAAKYRRLERVLIPILDILQSVPILGYLSFTITFFIALSPSSIIGVEMASIFAIFTSQVWNMTFSFYQGLKTIPNDLKEAAAIMKLSAFDRFFRLELPYSIPGLVWNMMMSMSAGWFFVVASEAIVIGATQYTLPGIGSYIAMAIAQKNIMAILYAILAMSVVIILYDQLLFRPIVAFAHKFKCESVVSGEAPKSWVLSFFRNTKPIRILSIFISYIFNFLISLSYKISSLNKRYTLIKKETSRRLMDLLWYISIVVICSYGGIKLITYIKQNIIISEVITVFNLGLITALRVIVLIILAAVVWVPIGVYIGLRPKLTALVQPIIQFLAAFPVNLLFPIAVILINYYQLNTNIWLSPLMIMGTQWYILFNVIAGVSTFPSDLKEVSMNFSIKGFLWWSRVMLPAIFPYLITGAITASGGAWNASIVSEIVNWGDTTLIASGLGSYITQATNAGDFNKIILGISMLSFMVIVFNRIIWKPLYEVASNKIRIDY